MFNSVRWASQTRAGPSDRFSPSSVSECGAVNAYLIHPQHSHLVLFKGGTERARLSGAAPAAQSVA